VIESDENWNQQREKMQMPNPEASTSESLQTENQFELEYQSQMLYQVREGIQELRKGATTMTTPRIRAPTSPLSLPPPPPPFWPFFLCAQRATASRV
jgi:hypothetical protein